MRNRLFWFIISMVVLCSNVASSDENFVKPLILAAIENKSGESGDIQELFNALEANMFPPSAFAAITLTSFKDKDVVKELNFEFVSKDGNVLIEIKGPKVDRGKYILKSGGDLWMYFSSIRRSIRIAARESFMGTDANNYDLLELDLVNGYQIILLYAFFSPALLITAFLTFLVNIRHNRPSPLICRNKNTARIIFKYNTISGI